MILGADSPPGNDGYVAAAYLVFLALLVIYVGIMAVRLGRMRREIGELAEQRTPGDGATPPASAEPAEPAGTGAPR